jgi:hypothetical protein
MSKTEPLSFDPNWSSPVGDALRCPSCAGPHVRIIGTPTLGGPEIVTTDDYEGLLGFRGNEWQLRGECGSCSEALTLCIAFNKGQTYLGWHLL